MPSEFNINDRVYLLHSSVIDITNTHTVPHKLSLDLMFALKYCIHNRKTDLGKQLYIIYILYNIFIHNCTQNIRKINLIYRNTTNYTGVYQKLYQ